MMWLEALSLFLLAIVIYLVWRYKIMPDVITDTYEISIGIIAHGAAEISNVVAPTEVEADEPFTIEYDVTNNGETDSMFAQIKNTADDIVFEGTRWDEEIPAGEEVHKIAQMPGISAPLNAIIEAGYTRG